jgi:hypothetical protein
MTQAMKRRSDMDFCQSCARELTDDEKEWYSFEDVYRCRQCFMYFEMINDVLWQIKDKNWYRTRGNDPKFKPAEYPTFAYAKEFWKRLDKARRITLVQIQEDREHVSEEEVYTPEDTF